MVTVAAAIIIPRNWGGGGANSASPLFGIVLSRLKLRIGDLGRNLGYLTHPSCNECDMGPCIRLRPRSTTPQCQKKDTLTLEDA